MNLIPKIRQGETISIEKLNALIDKVNSIEVSKRELENIRDEIRTDVEKYNSTFESIKASQSVVQQLSQSDSLETLTNLLKQFINTNTSTSSTSQTLGMDKVEGGIKIYIKENGSETAAFVVSQGADGAIGPQGPKGDAGIPGPRGEIGPRGFRGITGKQGEGSSVTVDYVNYVENTSLLPSDLQQYLRVRVTKIDSDGIETLKNTCYIPTQGYIYVPEIYQNDNPEDTASYIRFKKVVNNTFDASSVIDSDCKITGPQGEPGLNGEQGVPGTGLTCSNLVKLTDSHIFARKRIETGDTLEELLAIKTAPSDQNSLISELMSDVTTNNIFGLIPLDSDNNNDDIRVARKFTFVEKINGSWQLLRNVTFPLSSSKPVNLHQRSTEDPKTENSLSHVIKFGAIDYYKLKVGSSFIHLPSIDTDFKTFIYTVYERHGLDSINNGIDPSYYILVKNVINAGIEVPNKTTDILEAKEVILPRDTGVCLGYSLGKEHDTGDERYWFSKAFIKEVKSTSVSSEHVICNSLTVRDKKWLDRIYPIGSIYMCVAIVGQSVINPETAFGGKWEKIEGRFLLGSGKNYPINSEGGAAEVTLNADQLPAHIHGINGNDYRVQAGVNSGMLRIPARMWDNTSYTDNSGMTTRNNSPAGKAHNNMPPYLVVDIWKRTE